MRRVRKRIVLSRQPQICELHPKAMPVAQAKLIKPLRKLRKLLKRNTSPEETHDIRTNCRRLETMLSAVNVVQNSDGKSLLKHLPSVRKPASQVRGHQEFFVNYPKVRDIKFEIVSNGSAASALKLVNASRAQEAA